MHWHPRTNTEPFTVTNPTRAPRAPIGWGVAARALTDAIPTESLTLSLARLPVKTIFLRYFTLDELHIINWKWWTRCALLFVRTFTSFDNSTNGMSIAVSKYSACAILDFSLHNLTFVLYSWIKILYCSDSFCSASYCQTEAAAAVEKMTIPVPEGMDKPVSPKIDKLVTDISALNLLEVAELSEVLKKRLNLPDAPVMPVGGFAAPKVEVFATP